MTTNEPHNPDHVDTTRLPESRPDQGAPAPGAAPTGPGAPAPGTPGAGGAGAAPGAAPGGDPKAERRRRMRPVLIGTGIAAAVLLIGGGGIAIGAALSDDDDRDDRPVMGSANPGDERGERSDDAVDRDRASENGSSGGSTAAVPADAEALVDAIDAAIAEASGEGATSIEVERGGWDVDVVLADGTERSVTVALDGTATVRDEDSDRDDDPVIETDRVSDIVDAALAAAEGGTIESISTDNGTVRYDVSVDLGGGRDVDVELDDSLAVVNVDRD